MPAESWESVLGLIAFGVIICGFLLFVIVIQLRNLSKKLTDTLGSISTVQAWIHENVRDIANVQTGMPD